jgi:hypothetical protein
LRADDYVPPFGELLRGVARGLAERAPQLRTWTDSFADKTAIPSTDGAFRGACDRVNAPVIRRHHAARCTAIPRPCGIHSNVARTFVDGTH